MSLFFWKSFKPMNEVTFNINYCHLHHEITDWCRNMLGPGGWTRGSPETWENMGDDCWAMHRGLFGNITYSFKTPKHLSLFLLR